MNMLNHLLSAATESFPILATGALENMLASLASGSLAGRAFELQLPGRPPRRVGRGEIAFRLTAHDDQGLAALASLDECRIGEAYLDGALDLEGDLTAALSLRGELTDRHITAATRAVATLTTGPSRIPRATILEILRAGCGRSGPFRSYFPMGTH
jgi:hypothetical protein